jgi:anti-sigma B factor antagonist
MEQTPMSTLDNPDSDAVRLGPELTIAQAAGWRDTLVDALCATPGDLRLDLGSVTDIDSAGVQLLLATRRSVAERGATLSIVAASPSVAEALAVFGLDPALEPLASLEGADA